MRTHPDPDAAAVRRAEAQAGAIAHPQARAAGLSDDQIEARCRGR